MIPAALPAAVETDWLLAALLGNSLLVLALVFGLMFVHVNRYRHDSPLDRGKQARKTFGTEIGWTTATLLVFFGLFIWGADRFARMYQPMPAL